METLFQTTSAAAASAAAASSVVPQKAFWILPNVYYLGFKAGETIRTTTAWYLDHRQQQQELPSLGEVINALTHFPVWYKDWWLHLVAHDPIHVFVETTLIVSIIYILVSRSKDWREVEKEKLSHMEEEELLQEWKQHLRAPLAPSLTTNDNHHGGVTPPAVVVHQFNGRFMKIELSPPASPTSTTASTASGTSAVKEDSTTPPPTTTAPSQTMEVLNMATFDFWGLDACPEMAQVATQALNKYGCGSCGPRGFYGTIDVHLQLEEQVAKHMQTESAILYSDGASTCSSTIAAFCKRGDLLVVDEGVYEPIKTGVTLSRAHVKWFKHNDMDDLRRVLENIQATDRLLKRKPNAQRRFLLVEGLYKNRGTIVPLDEVVALKHEFSYRLILDESFSFGTLGETGRGVLEEYHKKPMRDAEVMTVSLENAVGSIGGLSIGTEEVVDHQRLSGSGYCFSASSPPFTAVAAMQALKIMQTRPELLKRLHENRDYMYQQLKSFCEKLEDLLLVTSDPRSPIVFLQVADISETEHLDEMAFLTEVVQESLLRGVAVVAAGPVDYPVRNDPPPGIRMTVSALHTKDDIDKALAVLAEAVDVVMSRFQEECMQ